MSHRKRYERLPNHVTAVQINLDVVDFRYRKWGSAQSCKQGDWLVNNEGDVYTIEGDYFKKYYRQVGPGEYAKVGDVWAEIASDSGFIKTIEGKSAYTAGDYLVFDAAEGGDAYAVKKTKFEQMYSLLDD